MSEPLDVTTVDGFRTEALAHGAMLLRVARRLIGDAHAAEDVVQEALARAFAGRASYRGEASARAWLCGVVVNQCRRELRRRRVRRWLSLGLLVEAGTPEPVAAVAPVGADLERAERAVLLRAALERLPEGQRAALTLVSQEGLSAREAGLALGTTEAAVWQAVSRARATLRRALGEELR